ncbi:MAG: helix-turn-helix domain-containing protein, partial [Pseudomonadota bacterium]
WLISERIEATKDLLTESNRPLEEIAAAVGFGSAHVLRQHFKQKVRLTPTQFRQRFSRFET